MLSIIVLIKKENWNWPKLKWQVRPVKKIGNQNQKIAISASLV